MVKAVCHTRSRIEFGVEDAAQPNEKAFSNRLMDRRIEFYSDWSVPDGLMRLSMLYELPLIFLA